MQNGEITVSKPKSTCLPAFLVVTEQLLALWFPWLTNELNRVGQPILVEHNMMHCLRLMTTSEESPLTGPEISMGVFSHEKEEDSVKKIIW